MKIEQTVKKIIFFDALADVKKYLSNNKDIEEKESNEQDCLFIAANPSVYAYLRQRKFSVQNTLPYFTNESHIKVLKKYKILADWMRKNFDLADTDMGIQRAYIDSFIYWTHLSVYYCLWVIEIVSNAVNIHKPEIICASLFHKRFVSSLLIEPEEKYLGHIVKIIAHEKNLKFENTSVVKESDFGLSTSWVKNHGSSIIKFIPKYVRFLLWEKMMSLRNTFIKNSPVFFTTRFYQMDKLAEEIQTQYPNKKFYFLQGPAIPSFRIPDFIIRFIQRKRSKVIITQKKTFENLRIAIKKEAVLFSFENVAFGEIVSQKIQDNIADYMLGLYLWTFKLNKSIEILKPFAILSNGNRPDDLILAELCNKKIIPTIMISHGSHIRPKNEFENIEWGEHGRALIRAPFSHLALQSPLSEGYLEVYPSESKVIKTGPLIWGRPISIEKSKLLFKKMFNGKYDFGKIKIVLHAGSPKRSKGLRPYVYETPDEYILALCELANAIEEISDVILIIKFRPHNEISVADLKNLVPFSEKVILSINESFVEVLGMTDLLVSFSSTTIEEALQNRIPVLLYGGGGRYQHIPAYEIKSNNSIQPSAIYHVKDAQYLENAICKILNLNIDFKKERHLFESYIYSQDARASLADLLRSLSKEEGRL